MRLFVVANTEKTSVQNALQELMPELQSRAEVVGVETQQDADLLNVTADAILVLGGDGTLLSVARRLHGRPIPLLGVNFGRLGFLASFTPEEFRASLDAFVARRLPVGRRLMLDASVIPAGVSCSFASERDVALKRTFASTALNDAVVTAGPPFHMVELELSLHDEQRVRYFGDGVIVSTPSGSTAYNISAGGPILHAGLEAMCITPICPHALTFRPVVIPAFSTVLIVGRKVNEGTTLFCDGQASTRLHLGDTVVVRRSPHDVLLMENPFAPQWRSLAEKLHWAVPPNYNGDSPTME